MANNNTLPDGWSNMVVGRDMTTQVIDKHVGWTWSGADTNVVGTGNGSGTGLFGFRVFRNPSGSQGMTVNKDLNFLGRIRYRVVVDVPDSITDFSLPRMYLELYCLGHATGTRLPRIGDPVFKDGQFGANIAGMDYPIVMNIDYQQEKEDDPTIWVITYSVERPPAAQQRTSPQGTGSRPNKPNIEENPWDIGTKVTVSLGSEDFVLGLGRFVDSKTPAEVGGALDNDTYAALFSGADNSDTELISNSAGDPLESPPPMKVSTATINITRAYETLPNGLAQSISSAVETVSEDSVTFNGITFGPYTCKLAGASISSEKLKRTADWLPKQMHPFRWTYADLGWGAPEGLSSSDVAYNYTKSVLPAFTYVTYYNLNLSVMYRRLGWGYALVDKGYRKLVNGVKTEITDVSHRQTYASILENGNVVDRADNTSNKKVLRLYQVLKSGSTLTNILSTVLGG